MKWSIEEIPYIEKAIETLEYLLSQKDIFPFCPDLISVSGIEISNTSGLCRNIEKNYPSGKTPKRGYSYISDILMDLSKQWPKFSGSIHYPVPAPDGFDFKTMKLYLEYDVNQEPAEHKAMVLYDNISGSRYVGEYGALRFELAEFWLEGLRQLLEDLKHESDPET